MIVNTAYFTIIRDPNEQSSSGGIGKRAQFPADIRGTGSFELNRKPLTQADENIQIFFIHTRIMATMINAIFILSRLIGKAF